MNKLDELLNAILAEGEAALTALEEQDLDKFESALTRRGILISETRACANRAESDPDAVFRSFRDRLAQQHDGIQLAIRRFEDALSARADQMRKEDSAVTTYQNQTRPPSILTSDLSV